MNNWSLQQENEGTENIFYVTIKEKFPKMKEPLKLHIERECYIPKGENTQNYQH